MKQAKASKGDQEVSKFLSYVLRHKPEDIGLTLDREGWADVAELLRRAAESGTEISREVLERVVAESDKKRFALSPDGLRIRAVQGHSTPSVDRDFEPRTPPETLFHGTAQRFMSSIREQGLLPGSRQYVHLSEDEQTALAVGQRHGKAVILRVNAAAMAQDGFLFHLSENGVWLTRAVPPGYLGD